MKYFLFINILIISTSCGVAKKSVASNGTAICILNPIKIESAINYNFRFSYNGNDINGKMLVIKYNEETSKGTIYSENGITLFNLEINNSYAKITYAYENLNNKYIKSSLEEDLKLIFAKSTVIQAKDQKHYVIYKDHLFNVVFINNTECTSPSSLVHKDKVIDLNNIPKEIIIKTNIYTISLKH